MARERNKPAQSWIERAKIEIVNEEELTIERAYELGKIRGMKDAIDKACEWIVKNNINYTTMDGYVIPAYDVVQGLRKAMLMEE